MAIQGQITIADITGFLLYAGLFYELSWDLTGSTNPFSKPGRIRRYFEVLDTEPDIHDAPAPWNSKS